MSETLLGDVIFILLVSGLIYGLLSLRKTTSKGRLSGDMSASDDILREIFDRTDRIAVVGASADPERTSHREFVYLRQVGFTVFAVNPAADRILDQACYAGLEDLPERVDIVDVFCAPEHAPEIARSAVAHKASVLWLQEGVVSSDALEIASAGGLKVVMDRCLEKEHRRLSTGD